MRGHMMYVSLRSLILLLTTTGICKCLMCPTPGRAWLERALSLCHDTNKYHCLPVRSRRYSKELCTPPSHFPSGSYPVLATHTNGHYTLDAVPCPRGRFQNTTYFTNTPGLTGCPYKKTECNERGQITIQTSPSMDNTCRCDKDAGYTFIDPNADKDCSPTSENCGCFKEMENKIKTLTETDNDRTPQSDITQKPTKFENAKINSGTTRNTESLIYTLLISMIFSLSMIPFCS